MVVFYQNFNPSTPPRGLEIEHHLFCYKNKLKRSKTPPSAYIWSSSCSGIQIHAKMTQPKFRIDPIPITSKK